MILKKIKIWFHKFRYRKVYRKLPIQFRHIYPVREALQQALIALNKLATQELSKAGIPMQDLDKRRGYWDEKKRTWIYKEPGKRLKKKK